MGIFDASFNTEYKANPSLLLQMEHLLSGATHAGLAKGIGDELTTLQNSISKANTNDYARKLEMMNPDDVLAMEAQGLDPRTARLGNGFIYNPEDEAIKNAFTNLKTKTGDTITGRVKRSNDRLTDKDKKELRKKGPISVEDLLALAGIDNSAYTDLAAIQNQADTLNSAFDSQAQKEAMDLLRGAPISDSRVKALWNGDNSFFTNNGYSEADAALFGDTLRNSAEGRTLITERLKDLYEHEQAENALNGNPVMNAVDWLMQQGYGNAGISLSDINPGSKEFATTIDNQRAIQNKVDFTNAKEKIANSLYKTKDGQVNPKDLQALLTSGTSEEVNAWLNSPPGTQAINSLTSGFLNELLQTENWKQLSNPYLDPVKREDIEQTVLSGFDEKLKEYNLQGIPVLKASLRNALQEELNAALSSKVGVETNLARQAYDKAKSNLNSYLMKKDDLAYALEDYFNSGDGSRKTKIDNNQLTALRQWTREGLSKIFNEIGLEDNDQNKVLRQELANVLYDYVLGKKVKGTLSDKSLVDFLESGGGASNLFSKGNGEIFGSKSEMVEADPIMEMLLGNDQRDNKSNDSDKDQLGARQNEALEMLKAMMTYRQAEAKQKEVEKLRTNYNTK